MTQTCWGLPVIKYAKFLAAESFSNKPMNQAQSQTQLIALDWGTSSLRAYRLGAAGRVLELRSLPWGVMKLPEVVLPENSGVDVKASFEFAFEEACGDWIRAAPHAPVTVSYTHLRAHETRHDLVCRLLLEKK